MRLSVHTKITKQHYTKHLPTPIICHLPHTDPAPTKPSQLYAFKTVRISDSLRRFNSGQLDCCCTDVSSGFVSRMCSCPSKSCWKPAMRSRVCSLNSSLLRCAMAASSQSHVSKFLFKTFRSVTLAPEFVMAYASSSIFTAHAPPHSIHKAAAAAL